MLKVSKRTRLAYVTVTALSSTFMSSAAFADCISQTPVDNASVICGGPGANGWGPNSPNYGTTSVNGLKVVVNSGATVTNSQGGSALINAGTGSSVINFSGHTNNGAVGYNYGIDAGSNTAGAIAVGGGSVVTNNSDAFMRGTVTFGNATGSAVNVFNNNYAPSGGANLVGALDGSIISAGNTTVNNQGQIGATAAGKITQTGAGTVIINNGLAGGYVAPFTNPIYQNAGIVNTGSGFAISTVGNTTLTNYGGGNARGAIIYGDLSIGDAANNGGTGASSIVNGSQADGNASIFGNITMGDKSNTITNDGTISGSVTFTGAGTNTFNAGSSGSSGDNGLRLPGRGFDGSYLPTGTVAGTLQGSTVAGSVNVLNLNGTGSSTLQAGSVIKGINTVNKNNSGSWLLKATLDGTAGKVSTVNVTGGTLATDSAAFLGGSGSTVKLSNGTTLNFNGTTAATFAGNIVDATSATTGQVTVTGANTTTLSGTNTYSGATTINGGKLATGSNGALSKNSDYTLANSGATLTVNNNNEVKSIADSGGGSKTINLNGAATSLTVGSGTFGDDGGRITGTGKLIKTGSGTLTLANGLGNINNYSGGTTVSGGVLEGRAGTGLQGNIVNNATVRFIGTGLYTGNMSGTGALEVTGGGLGTTVTGTNTYSGDTTVATGSTLIGGGTNSLSANSGHVVNGNLVIVGNQAIKNLGGGTAATVTLATSTLTLGGAGNYSYGGALIGPGALVVNNGGGSWTFASTGTTTIPLTSFTNNGNTILNGSLRATTGTNGVTGVLSGNGTFTGAFTNNGTIRPGSSPGILNFIGSYTQGATGSYVVDLVANNSSSVTAGVDYDQIKVTGTPGTATLNGNLTINQNGGQFVNGTVYNIITTSSPTLAGTNGNIIGNFSSFTGLTISPFISFTPGISNNTTTHTGAYTLTVVRSAYNTVANNPNQAAVAGLTSGQGLQGLVGLAGANAAIARIDNMTADQARDFYDQISPEPYAAYVRALQDQGNLFTRQVAHRMAQTTSEADAKMGVWGNLYGQWGNGKNRRFRFGSDQDIKGGALGVEGTMSGNLTLGAAVGYSEAKVDYNLGNSKGKSKSWQVGAYASYHPGNVVADLQVAYVHGKVRAVKGVEVGSGFSATSGAASARTSGNLFKVIGTVGYELGSETLNFRPFVGVDFTTGKLKGFNEHGTLDALLLSVGRQKADRTDLLVGFKFAPKMGSLQPYADATLRYGLNRNSGRVHAAFNGIATDVFTVSGQRSAKMQGELDAGLAYGIGKNASIFFGYEGTLRKSLTEHGVNGGVKLAF